MSLLTSLNPSSWMAGMLFETISDVEALGGSDLLNYLMFDGRLAAALVTDEPMQMRVGP